MSKKLSRTLVTIVILAIIASVLWYLSRPTPLEVTVAKVETGAVESVVANTRAGTIKPCRRARLAPAIGGQIAELPVHEGDRVRAGQVLLEMWNEDLRAELLLVKQDRVAAKARAKESCLRAEVAEREAHRINKLLQKKLASEDDADRANGQAQALRAACVAANETAKVNDAKVKSVQVALDRTILRAPFDGTVAEVNGEIGEFVTPSPVGIPTLPAVDLIDNSCIYVAAPIDEVDAPAIKLGMPARITLDAFKDHHFPGKVRRIAPYVLDVEKQARTVDIEVDFAHQIGEQSLLPGYSADVEVILAVKENTLRIPTEALMENQYVYVVTGADNIVEKRQISTGISNWVYTQVLKGLDAGDVVITSVNVEGLIEGAMVSTKSRESQ
jgi:HlyD family secretion protein